MGVTLEEAHMRRTVSIAIGTGLAAVVFGGGGIAMALSSNGASANTPAAVRDDHGGAARQGSARVGEDNPHSDDRLTSGTSTGTKARRGGDDPPGDDHGGHGSDDPPGDV
jgi:hypothetical protein